MKNGQSRETEGPMKNGPSRETEGAMKNGQFRETRNIRYTIHKTQHKKCWIPPYTRYNTKTNKLVIGAMIGYIGSNLESRHSKDDAAQLWL